MIDGKGNRSKGSEDKNQITWELFIYSLSKLKSPSYFTL
jgi:hypothetical protein